MCGLQQTGIHEGGGERRSHIEGVDVQAIHGLDDLARVTTVVLVEHEELVAEQEPQQLLPRGVKGEGCRVHRPEPPPDPRRDRPEEGLGVVRTGKQGRS